MLNVQNTALLKDIFGGYFSKFLLETLEMKKPEQNTIRLSNLRKSVLHLLLSNTGFQGDSMDNLSCHQPQECGALPKCPNGPG